MSGLSGEQCEEELAQYVTLIRKGKREQQKKHFIIFTRYAAVICSVDRGIYFWYQERGVMETSQKTMVLAVKEKVQPILVTEEEHALSWSSRRFIAEDFRRKDYFRGERDCLQPADRGKGQAVAGLHTLIIPGENI